MPDVISLRKRALALSGLVLLSVAVAVAGTGAAPIRAGQHHGGHGKVPASFFGVVPQDALSATDYQKMGDSGVKVLRAGLYWQQVQPTEGSGFNFSGFDQIVAGAAQNGITVLPYLYGSPDWVAKGLDGNECTDCRQYGPRTEVALAAWKDFVRESAARYGPGGDFWAENSNLPKKTIHDWQIWNEQNSKLFYKPKPSPARFAKVLSSATQRIRSQDKHAKIILGGMFGLPGKTDPSKAIAAATFIHSLLKIRGAKSDFDAIALHPYSPGLDFIKKQALAARRELRKSHYSSAEMWITETGAASGGPKSPLNLGSKKAQAKRVTDTLDLFTKYRSEWNVKLVAWFAWQDSATNDSCTFCAKVGLVTETGEAKPSLQAFKRAANKR